MNKGFVRVYLWSAAAILAMSALGKPLPTLSLNNCIEEPLLGSFQWQIHLSNEALYHVASAIETGILLLIIFSRRRWLPSLASGVWGAVCLAVRMFFLNPAARSCNCFGWFQQILPLPEYIVSTILVTFAGWLMLGGFAAFRFTTPTMKPGEREFVLVTGLVMAMCVGAFFWYFPPQPLVYGE